MTYFKGYSSIKEYVFEQIKHFRYFTIQEVRDLLDGILVGKKVEHALRQLRKSGHIDYKHVVIKREYREKNGSPLSVWDDDKFKYAWEGGDL